MSKRSATSDLNRDNYDDDDVVEEVGKFRSASESQLKERVIKKAKRRLDANGGAAPVFTNFTGFGGSTPAAPSAFSFGGSTEKPAGIPAFSFGPKKDDSVNSSIKKDETSKENKSPSNFSFGTKMESPPSCLKLDSPVKMSSGSAFSSVSSNGDSTKGKFSFSSPFNTSNVIPPRQVDPKEASPLSESSNQQNSSSTKDSKYLGKLKSLNNQVLKWMTDHIKKNPYINLSPIFQDYTKHFKQLKSEKSDKVETSTTNEIKLPAPKEIKLSEPAKNDIKLPETIQKKDSESTSSSLFSFGVPTANTTSSFGAPQSSSSGFNFSTTSASSTFSFGDKTSAPPSTGGFSFGNVAPVSKPAEKVEEDEPPKVEPQEVTEEGATYERKVKLFYKKDDSYAEKGVGMLFLKPAGEKTQLIVRAMTSLGTILLNIVLNSSIPCQRMGKNNVMIMCVPNPPIDPKQPSSKPVSMLIRVKTSEDADDLLKKLEESKQ